MGKTKQRGEIKESKGDAVKRERKERCRRRTEEREEEKKKRGVACGCGWEKKKNRKTGTVLNGSVDFQLLWLTE